MSSPMEVLLGDNRDKKRLLALSGGLRRNKEIAQLAMLSGSSPVERFGQGMYGDVQDKFKTRMAEKEKQKNRDLTQGYYNQIAGQNALANTMANRRMTETERHNLAMENRAIPGSVTPKDVSRGVQRLSAALDRGGTLELQSAMASVREELDKYKEKGSDIPGYGAGRMLPLPFLEEDGKALRTKVQAVTNILLKKRSGGAVTPQEAERLAKEFGATFGLSDKDFMNAWGSLESNFNAGLAGIFAGYDDEVIQAYNHNMGRQLGAGVANPSGKPEAPGTSLQPPESSPPQQGVTKWSDM